MLHVLIERNQHHGRIAGIRLKRLCRLREESEDDKTNVQTVITQMAALTTQSQLTATTTAKTQAAVTAAINRLAANQQFMQQQFAAT